MNRAVPILALAPLLASCQLGIEVTVTGPPSAPVFELAEAGWFGGGAPEISDLTVSTELAGGAWKRIWSVYHDGGCSPVKRIVYGKVPPGFGAEAPAPSLEPGRSYQVSVMGCGHNDGAWFKPLADRIVYRRGTGDAARRTIEAER